LKEEKGVFTQFEREFQSRLPVLVSRFLLTLPAGWTAQSVTFNHAADGADGLRVPLNTWELRDLPFIGARATQPSIDSLVPRLA